MNISYQEVVKTIILKPIELLDATLEFKLNILYEKDRGFVCQLYRLEYYQIQPVSDDTNVKNEQVYVVDNHSLSKLSEQYYNSLITCLDNALMQIKDKFNLDQPFLDDASIEIINPTLLLTLPAKFLGILKEAVSYRIESMQQLLDNPDATEEQLAYIDYGNDQVILTMILDDLKNPHNQIDSAFYQLTRNPDKTEMTLQEFGKPIPNDEQLTVVFSAKSFDEALAIKNQFLGFAPYKPMPSNIVAAQVYHYQDQKGLAHEITVTLYQPQQFGLIWQCNYQLQGYGESIYETVLANDSFSVIELSIRDIKAHLEHFESQHPNLTRI